MFYLTRAHHYVTAVVHVEGCGQLHTPTQPFYYGTAKFILHKFQLVCPQRPARSSTVLKRLTLVPVQWPALAPSLNYHAKKSATRSMVIATGLYLAGYYVTREEMGVSLNV